MQHTTNSDDDDDGGPGQLASPNRFARRCRLSVPKLAMTPAASKSAPRSSTLNSICRRPPEVRRHEGMQPVASDKPEGLTTMEGIATMGHPEAQEEGLVSCITRGDPDGSPLDTPVQGRGIQLTLGTVSPDWQSPQPVTRKGIVTATAEVDGVTRKRLWTAYVRPSPG